MKLRSALLALFVLCVSAPSQEKSDLSQRYLLLGDVTKQPTQQQVTEAAAAGFRIMDHVLCRYFLVMEKTAAAPDGIYRYMFLKMPAGTSKLRNRLNGAGARGYRLLQPVLHVGGWTTESSHEIFLILEKSPAHEHYQYWLVRSKTIISYWPFPTKHRETGVAEPPAGYQEVGVVNDYPWEVRIFARRDGADTHMPSRQTAQQAEVHDTAASNGSLPDLPSSTAKEQLELKGKGIPEFEAALNQAGARGFRLSKVAEHRKADMEKEAASEQRYLYHLVDGRNRGSASTALNQAAEQGYKPVGVCWLGGFWSWSGDPVIIMEKIAPAAPQTLGP